MKSISYFNQDPKSSSWLHKLNLKVGELVRVEGRTYRFDVERKGLDCVLTPVSFPVSTPAENK